jgi:hypothetical protein
MAYDITKYNGSYGREYYARDSIGWLVPVLFEPYFDWQYCFKRVQGGPNKGKFIATPYIILKRGFMQIWDDKKRILFREFYHNEDDKI